MWRWEERELHHRQRERWWRGWGREPRKERVQEQPPWQELELEKWLVERKGV